MTRKEFSKFQTMKEKRPINYAKNEMRSKTDPSFAMTGAQMFLAAMRGEPLPMNAVSYVYSGIDPKDMTIADQSFPDKFIVAQQYKTMETQIRNDYDKIKNQEAQV